MDAGNNFFNLTVIKGRSGGKEFVCALVIVVDKTRKRSEIICKDIFRNHRQWNTMILILNMKRSRGAEV